jgi:hypothetical protein
MDDQVLAALPCLPRLHTLHLELCLGLTDAGLTILKGLPALRDLSLAGCDGLTHAGFSWIARLPGLTSLNLEQCHRVTGLDSLTRLTALERLNLGWCSGLGDGDAGALRALPRLQDLRICHTKVTSAGLVHVAGLTRLTALSLGGLRVSDAAVAGCVAGLSVLRVLDLERCSGVEDGTMKALGCGVKHLKVGGVQ